MHYSWLTLPASETIQVCYPELGVWTPHYLSMTAGEHSSHGMSHVCWTSLSTSNDSMHLCGVDDGFTVHTFANSATSSTSLGHVHSVAAALPYATCPYTVPHLLAVIWPAICCRLCRPSTHGRHKRRGLCVRFRGFGRGRRVFQRCLVPGHREQGVGQGSQRGLWRRHLCSVPEDESCHVQDARCFGEEIFRCWLPPLTRKNIGRALRCVYWVLVKSTGVYLV